MLFKKKIEVLIIEDDDDLRTLMELMLRMQKITVATCGDAANALQKISETKPKVIVMDMMLNGHDGRDICKMIKAEYQSSNIKLVMASAHPDGRQLCLEAGADDFVAKPFEMENFLSIVKNALKQ